MRLSIVLEIKDTTDTARTASYLDIHLEIDSEGRLRMKLYDKRDDYNLHIVNFPFICSNNPAAPAYGVCMSLSWSDIPEFMIPIRISLIEGCCYQGNYCTKGFLFVKLKSSIRKFYGRHHDLVNRYGTSVSQMSTNTFHLS